MVEKDVMNDSHNNLDSLIIKKHFTLCSFLFLFNEASGHYYYP